MIQLSDITDGRSTRRDDSIAVTRWGYEDVLNSQANAWVKAGTYEPVTIAWLEKLLTSLKNKFLCFKQGERMNKGNLNIWLPIVTLVFGTLIGPGPFWNWETLQIAQSRLQLDQIPMELELREKMTKLLLDIMVFQSDSDKRQENYQEYKSKIANYNAMEEKLAGLESRKPNTVDFEGMIPRPPTSLEIR